MTHLAAATLVLIAFLLPGAFAAWGFQWQRSWYGLRSRDWTIRLAGFSALLLALGAWPLYWFFSHFGSNFDQLKPVSRWAVLAPVIYLSVPVAAGVGLAWASNRFPRIRGLFLSPRQQPSAWDHVFGTERAGFVRCRMRSGHWVGGILTKHRVVDVGRNIIAPPLPSYVGQDGPDNFDLYLSVGVYLNQDTGEPLREDDGALRLTGTGVLLARENIDHLEFLPR